LYGPELDRYAAQLATHLEQAGWPERAIPYHQRAAEAARRIYAQDEAIGHYQRALELIAEAPSAALALPEKARLSEELADLLSLTGRRDEARQHYARALDETESGDAVARARLWRKIGTAWDEENHWQEAEAGYASAEQALGPAEGQTDVQWWREWLAIQHRKMSLCYGLARLEQMEALAEGCRPVVERYGTAPQRGEYHRGQQMLGLRREHYAVSEQTVAEGQAAVEAFREAGDENNLTLTISGLGFTLLWAGRLDDAEALMLEGLECTERAGDVAVMSRVLTYLHVLYRRRGEGDQVRQYAHRALALSTERGQDEYAGLARASLAWLAWKEGRRAEAKKLALEAVALWQKAPLSTPFEWTARLVLLALEWERKSVSAAGEQIEAMLRPQQQRLPEGLSLALDEAKRAAQGQDASRAAESVGRVVEAARAGGYL
jgi:tetratricopeptide (TPR) repeat protein